jgi:lipopolysaccharide transport system ATP-binding protein
MSSEIAIRVSGLSKCFSTYERPQDRLKQSLLSLAARLMPTTSLRRYLQGRAQACARNYWALNDIHFELKKGETVGIIGRNGSGKSTLLQIICGTLSPTQGQVEVNGRVAALLELGSGFNPEYSGRENVYLNGQLLGLTREQIDARFDDIAAFADIGDFIEQPVKAYSSGMYVRLAFAVIAHVDADILVVDEALAVGDAFFTQKCMRFMRQFMEKGTILFVSHDTGAVKNLCKKALWLEKGQTQLNGSAKEVSEKYLEAFYESQQGKGTTTTMRTSVTRKNAEIILSRKDARQAWLTQTALRNDIRVFEFDPNSTNFGTNDADITEVNFFDEDGSALSWVVGGENLTLTIGVICHKDIDSPIIGFYIKDKLGQVLFGDNTYLTYHDNAQIGREGEKITAHFSFQMPILPKGDYSVCVAIAEGTNENHVQLKWVHDAVILRSESSSVTTGLVGIAMQHITMNISS